MTIRTNPPGAMVYVDRQPVGTTPLSDNFTYYGTRHIEIVKDGYRTETFLRKFHPPWYEIPPLDFVSENLWPFEKRDERIIDVQLVPDPVVPAEALIQSGEGLRLQAAQGIAVVPSPRTPIKEDTIGYPVPAMNQRYVDPTLPGNGSLPLGGIVPGVTPMQPTPANSPFGGGFLRDLLQPATSDPAMNVTPGNSYRPATSE